MGAPNTKHGSRGHRPHTRRQALRNTARENEGPGCPKTPPTHTYLESLEHARIISATNHVLAPRAARMRSCQGWVVASAACASNKGVGRPAWAGTPARTSGRSRFLAVLEGHPSPAARPGPIHGMGRAVCGQAHALRGWSHVWRAQRATREIQIAQPLRTRASHDLHTWVRPNQLVLSITVIW
jgi:hypothetical protein